MSDRRSEDFKLKLWLAAIGLALAVLSTRLFAAYELSEQPQLSFRANGDVRKILRLTNGAMIILGDFDSVQGTPREGIARLDALGNVDLDWNVRASLRGRPAYLRDVVAGPTGDIYLAGTFDRVNGVAMNAVVKVLDGATAEVDDNWASPFFDTAVTSSLQVVGAHLLVGGGFITRGSGLRNLVKLSQDDGNVDTGWAPEPNGHVDEIVATGDALLVAGSYTQIAGAAKSYLAKIRTADAQMESTFEPAPDSFVRRLHVVGTHVYVIGSFSRVGAQERAGIARLSVATGKADDWSVQVIGGTPKAIHAEPDAIYLGGTFTQVDGQARPALVKVSSSDGGTVDAGWDYPVSGTVSALAVDQFGALWVGGDFTEVGGGLRTSLAVIDATMLTDIAVQVQRAGRVRALELMESGEIFAGGSFSTVNGHGAANLVKIRADGNVDTSWTAPTDGEVADIASDGAGSIFVAGSFARINGAGRPLLAKVDAVNGAVDSAWDAQIVGTSVSGLLLQGESMYVAGNYIRIQGEPRTHLARISTSTAALAPALPMLDGRVRSMVATPAGELFIGGEFRNVGASPHQFLAKLKPNGLLDTAWRTRVNDQVNALALDATGEWLYAGGYFRSASGPNVVGATVDLLDKTFVRLRAAKLRVAHEGGVDAHWDPSLDAAVERIAVTPTGSILVSGTFSSAGSVYRAGLAELDGHRSGAPSSWAPPVPNGELHDVSSTQAGGLLFAGHFSRVGEADRSGVAFFVAGDALRLFSNGFEAGSNDSIE